MTAYMPPRAEGLHGIPQDAEGVVVGKIPVRGIGLRVGLQGAGKTLVMTPARARRFAREFEQAEAVAAGLDWIGRALIEAADEIDATPHAEQMRLATEAWATLSAKGPRQ